MNMNFIELKLLTFSTFNYRDHLVPTDHGDHLDDPDHQYVLTLS